jgi:hypothetical protein
MRHVNERISQLLDLGIIPQYRKGFQIPDSGQLVGEFDGGSEYIGWDASDGRVSRAAKDLAVARRILVLEGRAPPKSGIRLQTHYLFDDERDQTFMFELPHTGYLSGVKT